MKKKVFICLFMVGMFLFITGCSKNYNLNETVMIKEDQIKITVLGSEKQTINEGELSLQNGNYVKINMTIENLNSTPYYINPLNFEVGKSLGSSFTQLRDDALHGEIPAGGSVTGYIYFEENDAEIMSYIYRKGMSTTKYNFKIK